MAFFYEPSLFQMKLFTEEETKHLSKCRILQKNLVHFQGFPDYLYNANILNSFEYFGQYGQIIKITLSYKMNAENKRRLNSAYITFATREQAAYAILSVDSIKINDQLVRAFFGTTKYCNHFLNNFNCYNEEKCMFLHHLVDLEDTINENLKFGYSEHIKLAKKIIEFGSLKSKLYVINSLYPLNPVLPAINTIYNKEKILAKSKNHQRNLSTISNDSNNISGSTQSNGSNSFLKEENELSSYLENQKEENENEYVNEIPFVLFKSKSDSRFFPKISSNNQIDLKNKNIEISENICYMIDFLIQRLAIPKENEKNLNELSSMIEIEFCKKLYSKTKEHKIKEIMEQIF